MTPEVIAAYLLLCAGALLVWRIHPFLKGKERDHDALTRMRGIPETAITEVQDQTVVKVRGTVHRLSESLTAPLSQRPCAVFRVEVRQQRDRNHWAVVIDHADGVPFRITQGGQEAIVRGHAYDLALEEDHKVALGALSPSPALRQYLAQQGVEPGGFLGIPKNFDAKEAVIEEGELVTVLGFARWERDPSARAAAGNYRGDARCLVIGPLPKDGWLLVSDRSDS